MKQAPLGPKQRKAFRDNYLAAIIAVAALFFTLSASAQKRSQLQQVNAYGYTYKAGEYRILFYLPLDTLHGVDSGAIAYKEGKLWVSKDTLHWEPYGKAVQLTDSSFIVGSDTITISGGSNLANAALTADDDYTHDWDEHWLYINNLKSFGLNSDHPDGQITSKRLITSIQMDSSVNAYPFRAAYTLRNTADDGDSIHADITMSKSYVSMYHFGASGARTGFFELNGTASNPYLDIQVAGSGKSTQFKVANVTTINPADSIQLKAVPAATADSVLAIRAFSGGLNTVIKIPTSAIGISATLSKTTKDATLVKDYLTGSLKYRRQTIDTSVAQQYNFNKFHLQTTPLNSIWANLTWSPERKLLVATSHSSANPTGVMTSPDGITWTLRATPQLDWRGVAWSPKLQLFASVASTGTNDGVMTSPDGVTWTQGTLPNSYFYRYIIWIDELNLFIAVANTNGVTDKVITSPDGITWTARTCPDAKWNQIAWAPEKQLLVACAGTTSTASQIMTSPDGINWASVTDTVTDNGNWETIAYSQDLGLFVVGDFVQSGVGVPGKRIATSPDGIVWTRRNTPADGKWLSAAWSPEMGMFLCVGNDQVDENQAMISTDGINWSLIEPAAIKAWRRTIWVKELGCFVVLAYADGSTPNDNLVQLNRPIDNRQQYVNIYGRDSAQSIQGVLNFKDTTHHQKASVFNDVAYFNDSITQATTTAINSIRSKSYFGNRSVEGTNYNFFATSILRTFNEQTLAGNPTSHTTNFGAFQYWHVNSGSVIDADNAITNSYTSSVFRFAGNATVANSTNLNLKAIRQDLLYTKFSGSPGAATITGPTSVTNSNTTVQTTTGATGATGPLAITGWHSGQVYLLQLASAAHSIESYADIILGKSFTSGTATTTNRHGLYILPIKQSWVTNGYSIYQEGASDTNYLAGKIRMPNLDEQVDTTTIKPTGVDAAGNLYKMAGWPGGGGSGITSLNSLTGSSQTFATGTSGTDFGISSSGTTHTFNIPDASGSARGLITTGTQTIAGYKTIDGSLRVKGATDKNLEFYSFGGDMYMFSINDARTTSPTNTFFNAGTNFIFQDYNTGSLVERARFSGNDFLIGSATNNSVGRLQVTGKITVSAHDVASNADSALVWDRSTNEYKVARIGTAQVLKGTTNWTPGVVAAGSSTSTTITVTGAAVGDPVTVSKKAGQSNGEIYDGSVTAPNTVTLRVHNVSTGSANYNTAEDYNVIVLKY